jgi:uncharacterized membrane protein
VTISEIKTKLVGAGSYLLPRTAPVILKYNNKKVASSIFYNHTMMNVRNFLIVIISVTASLSSLAQSNLLNAKIPEEIGLKLLLNLSQIMISHWLMVTFMTEMF